MDRRREARGRNRASSDASGGEAQPESLTVAAVQMEPRIGDVGANLGRCLGLLEAAKSRGAELAVFPECALTGYAFGSLAEAAAVAQQIPGPSTQRLAQACQTLGIWAVVGTIESDAGQCYNSAAVVGPAGLVGVYRKTHLPFLGADRFLRPGEGPLAPWREVPGRLGVLICYDLRFPEAVRAFALQGTEVLALPTNWPEGAEVNPSIFGPARAAENRIYLVAANRVGVERGTKFIGRSQIVDVTGRVIVEGSTDREDILCATLDLTQARRKRTIIRPGEYELDVIADRRPELYGLLTERRQET